MPRSGRSSREPRWRTLAMRLAGFRGQWQMHVRWIVSPTARMRYLDAEQDCAAPTLRASSFRFRFQHIRGNCFSAPETTGP